MALWSRCPSIHFFVSRSRSVADCAHIQAFTFLLTKTLSRSRSVVWCVLCACGVCGVWDVCVHVVLRVVLVVCTCGVVCGVGGVCVVVLWWCVCVVCGEAWHTLSLLFSLLLLLFPFFLSLIFIFSLLFLFLFLFLFLLLLLLLLLLRHLNVIWCIAIAQQSVLSLLLSPPSSLLSLSSSKKKRELFITGIFPARNLFLLQF